MFVFTETFYITIKTDEKNHPRRAACACSSIVSVVVVVLVLVDSSIY